MYTKDGTGYFIVDGHTHFWDGSPANQANRYGEGFIKCFYDYHISLSPQEYDQFVRDTVNFLDYIGEPMQLERRNLGMRVLAFLIVFFLFAYFLKKEFWKDVK